MKLSRKAKAALIGIAALLTLIAISILMHWWLVLVGVVLLIVAVMFLGTKVGSRSHTVSMAMPEPIEGPILGQAEMQNPYSDLGNLSFAISNLKGDKTVDAVDHASRLLLSDGMRHANELSERLLCEDGVCGEDVVRLLNGMVGQQLPNSVRIPRPPKSNFQPRTRKVEKRFGIPTWSK